MSASFKQKPTADGFFITGTDTDVGKTYAAACIALTLRQHGIPVSPRKPVASGCIRQDDQRLLCGDARILQHACGSKESLETICRYQFSPPISPQRAIQQAGLFISTADLVTACTPAPDHFALVEGAGGFYSPLSSDGLNADLAVQLNYPVILVVGNKLGCLNHALLTLEAIYRRSLTAHSVILNDVSADADNDNYYDLKRLIAPYELPCYHLRYTTNSLPVALSDFVV
ncbi:dethiobiotin synthase [Thiomicrorhabdus cannonii]|uniref:dethiobiotin synthase n=1 Tax=Thiomicrorhabdus cannonii TaxID=2748011 RepID=UPI0015BED77C|nr:dethiobiotin synthase [Thiomicrorhabdus cannonii]